MVRKRPEALDVLCLQYVCKTIDRQAADAPAISIHDQRADIHLDPQAIAACCYERTGGILRPWVPNHESRSTARQSGHLRSGQPRRASRLIGSPATLGTSACSDTRDQPSPRPLWATHSMLVTAISKSDALVAIPIRPSPSTLCVVRRRRQSMNWSATCDARTARRFGATRTSAAIW
jgi:hypothetical protein